MPCIYQIVYNNTRHSITYNNYSDSGYTITEHEMVLVIMIIMFSQYLSLTSFHKGADFEKKCRAVVVGLHGRLVSQ